LISYVSHDDTLDRRVPRSFVIEKARKLQLKLAKRVLREDLLPPSLKLVAGVDVSYSEETAFSAVAVLNYENMELVEAKCSAVKTRFPYVPTLLSFREAPAIFSVLKKLESAPDVYLIDGQGVAHPYGFGLASHVGVIAKVPTIGIAKSRLFGKVTKRKPYSALISKGNEVVGVALTTKAGRRPIYVSVGHMVSLNRAVEIVKHCIKNDYQTAKPIIMAHKLANEEKWKARR